MMILYNGATGSLARSFAAAAKNVSISVTSIISRLENLDGFRTELTCLTGRDAIFIPFAAKVSVPWCEAHSEEARRTNIEDTIAAVQVFVEECRSRGIEPTIVYISSAHVYVKSEAAIHETDPVFPRSVYAKSKLEAERRLLSLSEEFGFSIRIPRVFGLVAPVQPAHYVLHALLRRAREGDVHNIPGLSNERDYLDSRDVCRSIIELTKLDESKFARVCPDRVLNFGSGRGITIRKLAEKCILASRSPDEAERLLTEMSEAIARADDVPRIIASIDRYRALFGEEPARIPIETTIRDALAARG